MINYKFFISCLGSNVSELKKDELVDCVDYMVDSLWFIGFNFKSLVLMGIDYYNCSSLSLKNLRFLFNYLRQHYLYYFLGFVNKK